MVTAFPPAKIEPPLLEAYQSKVAPADAVALNKTGPGPVLALSTGILTIGKGFTVMLMVLEAMLPSATVIANLL